MKVLTRKQIYIRKKLYIKEATKLMKIIEELEDKKWKNMDYLQMALELRIQHLEICRELTELEHFTEVI